MGNVKNISANAWPKQGRQLGERCRVFFHYDTSRQSLGTIVRDDMEAPFVGIIRLDDGRTVLTTECQYQPDSLSVHRAAVPQQEPPT